MNLGKFISFHKTRCGTASAIEKFKIDKILKYSRKAVDLMAAIFMWQRVLQVAYMTQGYHDINLYITNCLKEN